MKQDILGRVLWYCKLSTCGYSLEGVSGNGSWRKDTGNTWNQQGIYTRVLATIWRFERLIVYVSHPLSELRVGVWRSYMMRIMLAE